MTTRNHEGEACAAADVPAELVDDTGALDFVPAPCQVACPIGTDAPSYLAYIWEGNLAGALEAITATNPLSGICGRVCDAPCEPACRRADSDGPVAIRNLKRYVMDQLGSDYAPATVAVTRAETVAIVGSGPTGLTAAQDLAEAGYEVHLYEMTDRLGGMATWGIPAFRLPPAVIQEDIDRILRHCPGIKVHLHTALGEQVTLAELKDRHDAVLLAIGAWWGKKMEIAGEDDPRVIDGVSFLRQVNAGERPEMPETVLVIGAGDVSMDACRVAKRLSGCHQVKVIYRRGPDEIPARQDELQGAIAEGIEFVYFTQPVACLSNSGDGDLRLRCLRTELGEPDADGRRRPLAIAGSEHDLSGGLIIAAVGQVAACDDLKSSGLLAANKVTTDFAGMRTSDRQVFAAGDGAFGPSTLVNAIYHGHRVAYYVKAFLEGQECPAPYRTPYRTRRVPVSQDPEWEIFSRQEQDFHGLGAKPIEFPEIESRYTPRAAKCEAARCFRCDAENGTVDYAVRNREDIFLMARTETADSSAQQAMLGRRLIPRDDPFPAGRPASVDDIHFLPANLSRLVIDPYREACSTETRIGDVVIEYPFVAAGFDSSPVAVRKAVAAGLAGSSCPHIGARPLGDGVPWLQLLPAGDPAPSPDAAAIIYALPAPFAVPAMAPRQPGQLLGVLAGAAVLAEAIPWALDEAVDLLILDATLGMAQPWPEVAGPPDLTVLRDTVRILRQLRQEETLTILYFGGMRSGTDAAKFLALGCDAVIASTALALAAGGSIEDGTMAFSADLDPDTVQEGVTRFLKACCGEASMMARCTGKTNVHNLEPEDLRPITQVTADAIGIALRAGG